MAEFVEVMRNKKRLCENYNCTHDCPLKKWATNNFTEAFKGCYHKIINNPQEAEDIIMKWSEENPIITNADKFKEVF